MHRTDLNTDLLSTITSNNSDRKPAASAGTWSLGDLSVNRLGFGAKRLAGSGNGNGSGSGGTGAGRVSVADKERMVGLLRQAVELGVNHLDTAAFYPTFKQDRPGNHFSPLNPDGPSNQFTGLNTANEVIQEALAPYPDDLVIATKVGPLEGGLARPDQLRGLVEENLRQLKLDTLDVVYLRQHGLDSIAEHFAVLAELREQGMIRHLGLSNVRLHHLAQAQQIAPVVAVQNRYGVGFGRVNDEILRVCGEQGIAFVPFFAVTATGREAGGVAASDPVLAIAREHGATPAQIRIAWTLAQGPHVLAIPGTGNPAHLTENLAAADIHLSPAQLATLDAIPSQ
ncbi:aryl-alcohol dehydrogenase-like predicted oxidoreductase [Kribbella orskensis]|uniref:Aryl-alcohol dehydrogenase-like predicted oxidoreductase n=1 Tax=Kribbella orskensis TaxID=2512216 RepID=A0ABY2BDG7_9ACTN|nr:aryl-alcohol dehydrogenase-like predicted oxidoreductase [Kribbella sp. VKM Ac-2500]TCO17112.1 aryl-alcohol dehydrogenase-like predicted oxidoreductase [Kribbella orskensis]